MKQNQTSMQRTTPKNVGRRCKRDANKQPGTLVPTARAHRAAPPSSHGVRDQSRRGRRQFLSEREIGGYRSMAGMESMQANQSATSCGSDDAEVKTGLENEEARES